MINQCPPGMLCIQHSNIIILILIVLMFIYYLYINNILCKKTEHHNKEVKENINTLIKDIKENNKTNNILIKKKLEKETLEKEKLEKEISNYQNKLNSINENVINNRANLDYRNELVEPLKTFPNNRINIKTRGEDYTVQQLGTLSRMNYINSETDIGKNQEPYILALYGRPTYNRSSKWNYYTIFNNVKLNINYKNKLCMNEYGCEELMNGDEILIPEINGKFIVNLYENKQLQYIPY